MASNAASRFGNNMFAQLQIENAQTLGSGLGRLGMKVEPLRHRCAKTKKIHHCQRKAKSDISR